jgi:hypothetical protein
LVWSNWNAKEDAKVEMAVADALDTIQVANASREARIWKHNVSAPEGHV